MRSSGYTQRRVMLTLTLAALLRAEERRAMKRARELADNGDPKYKSAQREADRLFALVEDLEEFAEDLREVAYDAYDRGMDRAAWLSRNWLEVSL